MATHSSILAWRIPWTEEPGELQSTGLQRVRQDKQRSIHAHRIYHQNCCDHTAEVRWIPQPKSGSEVKTDDVHHVPKRYEKVYYSHENFWRFRVGCQTSPKKNHLRDQRGAGVLGFYGGHGMRLR